MSLRALPRAWQSHHYNNEIASSRTPRNVSKILFFFKLPHRSCHLVAVGPFYFQSSALVRPRHLLSDRYRQLIFTREDANCARDIFDSYNPVFRIAQLGAFADVSYFLLKFKNQSVGDIFKNRLALVTHNAMAFCHFFIFRAKFINNIL